MIISRVGFDKMGWFQDIKQKMTKTAFWVLLLLVGGYFTINAIFGERGLQKLVYLQKEVAHARNIADHYRRNKETLDQQVKLLSSESLDLDMLDERARTVLNFVGEGEFVILDEE